MNKVNNHSELLHVREVPRVRDALHHLVAVLDVLVEVLDARVEDVGEGVLPEVLHREDPEGLGVRVLLLEPQGTQLHDGVDFSPQLMQ